MLQEKCSFRQKTAVLHFWARALWGLAATYTVHLRLIGRRIVDFLLVLIELFARCYGWGATSETDWKSAFSKERDQFGTKFQVQGVVTTNHFFTVRKLDEWTFYTV